MSPWADAFIGDLAATLVSELKLGQSSDRTEMLAVGFSALDYLGHNYGPRSHEVQDMLARLDRVLGMLMATLDSKVGRDGYTIALSSDHGVALLPEQAEAVTGTAGGRVSLNALGRAIELSLSLHFGRQRFIEALTANYAYFLPGVLDRIRSNPDAKSAVESAVRAVAGIDRVYWSDDLAPSTSTNDPFLRGLRLSYVAGRSGDLTFLPRVNWIVTTGPTTHGSMHPYDTDVPMIFYGRSIKPGRYGGARTPLDIAPTLASIAGITMPRAEGRAIDDIIAR
jgi:arylsulfatase A-like enzyme